MEGQGQVDRLYALHPPGDHTMKKVGKEKMRKSRKHKGVPEGKKEETASLSQNN